MKLSESVSQPGGFTLGARPSNTHGIGSWMGLSVGLDAVEKREMCCPCWEFNPNFSDILPLTVAIPTKLSISI
jgi:hypothetical protein